MGVYIPGQDIYVLGLSNCDCDIAALALKDLTSKKK
jgi:hypothetical protein